MRATTLLRTVLGLKDTRILGCSFTGEGLVVDVAPSWRLHRCSGCGRPIRACYDTYRNRTWRHLDLAGMKVWLIYDPKRVDCDRCGVVVEKVPWAGHGYWFTTEFEDMVGYLAQRCDKTTVSNLMRISWRTVGDIIGRVVERHGEDDPLTNLRFIGVDELSYRRNKEFITVVIDHQRKAVVWAHPGKNAETLKKFFHDLGGERCKQLEAVTIDMSGAYIKAVTEATPEAKVIFDRFHVQRLAHKALDEVRLDEARKADSKEEKKAVKKTKTPLNKNPWNLTRFEKERLAQLQRDNKTLYRAYLLKESLLAVLDRRQVNVARVKLDEWISWAMRSRLAPFKKLAGTIRDHADGILEYVRSGLSNGRTEALNGKTRTITRRSYGFHSASSLISMIFLCCSGIELEPVFTYPNVA